MTSELFVPRWHERVVRAWLTGEADVAEANISDDARRGENEVDEVATVGREILDGALVDDARHLRAIRFDERRRGGDGHRLRHADFHLQVERNVGADADDDPIELHRLKAGKLGSDTIRAGRQKRDVVVSLLIRDDAAIRTRRR